MKTTDYDTLRAARTLKNPDAYRKGYEEAVMSFDIAELAYTLRSQAGLTQKQLAVRMKTSQAAIARLESGGQKPSLAMLERLAQALNVHIRFVAEPINEHSPRHTKNLAPLIAA